MRYVLILLLNITLFQLTVYSQQTVGIFSNTSDSWDGYTLFAPMSSTSTYLIDNCGNLVHTWPSTYRPGLSVYLLDDGSILRAGKVGNPWFTAGGNGGVLQRIDWDGSVTWSYQIASEFECQHHDFEILPNGNILVIVWDSYTNAEALAQGRTTAGDVVWSDKIIELEPVGSNEANIVWEWYAWDHLIQDADPLKPSYGLVSEHPELININFTSGSPLNADWLHINAIDYNEALDQIIMSNHNFSEAWIIDHSTTTEEAASHLGGNSGKGGDLLYRWGNPAAYERGTAVDKRLYKQHDAKWIPEGFPDAGKILLFNNGIGRSPLYSSVDIFSTPEPDENGNYFIAPGAPFEPTDPEWEYTSPDLTDFYSSNISGAQRLPNGNTLICEGDNGNFFEVDTAGNIVWKYINPVTVAGPVTQGTIMGVPPYNNNVFRAERYAVDHPGLADKDLSPQGPLELEPLDYGCVIGGISCNVNSLVSGLTAIPSPSGSNVALSWDVLQGADFYQAKGRRSGTVPFGQFVTANNFKNVGGLIPSTSYEWMLRAMCEDGQVTQFTPLATFVTVSGMKLNAQAETIDFDLLSDGTIRIMSWGKGYNSGMVELISSQGKVLEKMQINGESLFRPSYYDRGIHPAGIYLIRLCAGESCETRRFFMP